MAVKRYVWREGHQYGADANAVGREIERVGKRLGKEVDGLSAEDVVEAARVESSPLHGLFTWDDSEAAEEWRKYEARGVMRSIRIVKTDETGAESRSIVYAAVRVEGEKDRLYVPVSKAMRQDNLRRQMIAAAISGLEGWKARFCELADEASFASSCVDAAIKDLRRIDAETPKKIAGRKRETVLAEV